MKIIFVLKIIKHNFEDNKSNLIYKKVFKNYEQILKLNNKKEWKILADKKKFTKKI